MNVSELKNEREREKELAETRNLVQEIKEAMTDRDYLISMWGRMAQTETMITNMAKDINHLTKVASRNSHSPTDCPEIRNVASKLSVMNTKLTLYAAGTFIGLSALAYVIYNR